MFGRGFENPGQELAEVHERERERLRETRGGGWTWLWLLAIVVAVVAWIVYVVVRNH